MEGRNRKKPSKLDDYEDFDKLSSSGCSGKPPLKKPRKALFEVNLDPPKSLNSVDLSTSSVKESNDENNDADNKDLAEVWLFPAGSKKWPPRSKRMVFPA